MAAQFYGDRAAGWLGVDFRAYYCAASAQRNGENPYYAQPLHACESVTPAPYYRPPRNVTVPAPYPPYALALFYPLTLLPFGAAMVLWWTILAGAILLAILALARLAAQPLAVAVAALGLALGLTAFASGNVMPLGFAAVLGAAYAMHRGRPLARCGGNGPRHGRAARRAARGAGALCRVPRGARCARRCRRSAGRDLACRRRRCAKRRVLHDRSCRRTRWRKSRATISTASRPSSRRSAFPTRPRR